MNKGPQFHPEVQRLIVNLGLGGFMMLSGIVEHARAKAARIIVAQQHIIIHAALATLPEGRIVRQFGESHGHIAQFRIDFHHRQSRGETENLCIGETLAGQLESFVFDFLGQASLTIFGFYDQAGIGNKLFMSPTLDVTEMVFKISSTYLRCFSVATSTVIISSSII